jgi:hypothetical protein
MIEHVGVAAVQRAGFPSQRPEQQSSLVAQTTAFSAHAEVHTGTPPSVGEQLPLQQVSPEAHGAPRGRHGPPPNSQRPVVVSQPPQHGGMSAPPWHVSPGSRQRFAVRRQMLSGAWHSPEQQSAFWVHVSPARAQSAPPQTPPLQASEQQAAADVHGVPSTAQYAVHCFSSDTSTGSHRPLQQSLRPMHFAPGALHEPAGRQVEASQRPEQQSELAPHTAPLP